MWDMSPRIEINTEGFHHQVVWKMDGCMSQRNLDGTWTYPSLEDAMSEAGIQEVET